MFFSPITWLGCVMSTPLRHGHKSWLPGYLGPAAPLDGKQNNGLPNLFTSQSLKTVNMRTERGEGE